MLDPLPIQPFTLPAAAAVRLPGSKSITNRALLLAALGEGETKVEGALFSEDTELMVAALRELGFTIEADSAAATLRVKGEGGRIPNRQANLFVGNAGTAARFLTAFCCLAQEGDYVIDGVPQMRRRPMKGLVEALRSLGAKIESADGFFPIRVCGGGLAGGEVRVDARESSQMLSALLMVAPYARQETIFAVPQVRLPFVLMTLRMMEQFGQENLLELNRETFEPGDDGSLRLRAGAERIRVPAGRSYVAPGGGRYRVEADATAASYFLALPLVVGGRLTIENFSSAGKSLQGDSAFLKVLEKAGCRLGEDEEGRTVCEFSGEPSPTGLDIDFSGFSDTFLTLAALSPLLPKPLKIRGIAHTRKQETDRVAAMAAELGKLGQQVVENDDSLEISPLPLQIGSGLHEVDTYGDHRFAMSFGILGCLDLHGTGQPWLAIRDPGCCGKTFPDFFRALESLRQRSHQPPTV
jgi:3-phosphoshikimate 1-carboxyvinyltransferase